MDTKKITFVFLTVISLLILFSPKFTLARIGVGVGTGKIVVDQELHQGTLYDLPSVTVLNTGDENSDYSMDITYHEAQTELMPPKEWFKFTPSQFSLTPGQVQEVKISLNIPIKTTPGNYFAYLEAFPVKINQTGVTSVSIAAASKLYFTITPTGLIQGVYYRAISFWSKYTPWTNIFATLICTAIIVYTFKKHFKLKISLQSNKPDEDLQTNNQNSKEKK